MESLHDKEPNDRSESSPTSGDRLGVVLLDREGRIVDLCSGAETVLGLKASEWRGRRAGELLDSRGPVIAQDETWRERPVAKTPEGFDVERARVEVRLLGDAPAIPYEAVLLTDGSRESGADDTCRIIGRLLIAAPLLLFVLESPSRVVFWGARQTLDGIGVDPDVRDEPVGRFLSRTLHPADVGAVLEQLDVRSRPDAVPPVPLRVRVRQKDGSWLTIRTRVALVWRAASGRIRRLFGVAEGAEPGSHSFDEERSCRILGGVSEAANALLSVGELALAVPQALGAVARVLDVETVAVRQFRTDEILRIRVAEAKWEWSSPEVTLSPVSGALQQVPFDGRLARWYASLADGEEISGVAGRLPEEEQREFDERRILAAIAVPIRVHSRTWGCLELADGRSRRDWATADRDATRVLASHLGYAIEREMSDRRLRTLSRAVEQSPSAILIANARGTTEYVNPKFSEATGWAADDVLGEDPALLISRRISPRLFERLLDVVRSGTEWRGELNGETRSGASLWFDVSISPVRDTTGRTTHYVAIEEDVTARRIAEQLSRAERERYRLLFDSIPALVWIADRTGSCLGVNRRWLTYTGQAEAAFAGDGWLTAVELEDRKAVREAVRRALEISESTSVECRLSSKTGSSSWFLLTVEPIRGQTTNVEELLGVCVDISKTKETEREIVTSREELRALMSRIVSVREEDRRAFARELHDGVGQALTGLALELASVDRIVGPDRPDVSDRLRVMSQEVADTLEDVRDLARRIRPAALDLGLVAALEGEMKAFGRRSGITWDLRAEPDLEPDPERSLALFRSAQEALTNVVRHAAARHVLVRLAADDGNFVLEVGDDGRGIDPAVVSRRAGLGLVGLRERIAPWGGTVRLEPNDPVGARTIVEVPFPGVSRRGAGSTP